MGQFGDTCCRPGQYLSCRHQFGPGCRYPYAMAAKLAYPEKKVLLLTGDGAFGYGAMEYDRHSLQHTLYYSHLK